MDQSLPTYALITALPKEFAAMRELLDTPRDDPKPGRGAGRRYTLGSIPSRSGGTHRVVLALTTDTGNNSAAIRATQVLTAYPVHAVIMVGIAGGVPHPSKPEEHVRLGDIVVSNRGGVVQYEFIKESVRSKESTEEMEVVSEPRHPPRPPSAELIEAVRLLEADAISHQYPWLPHLKQVVDRLRTPRPDISTDILADSADPTKLLSHPHDHLRRDGEPRIFQGPIAAASILLKNPLRRDRLRDQYDVKAIEMEGAGIADATWTLDAGYLVVRGVCDYCDGNKGDAWQAYAAAAAAAYVRALFESMPSGERWDAGSSHDPSGGPGLSLPGDRWYRVIGGSAGRARRLLSDLQAAGRDVLAGSLVALTLVPTVDRVAVNAATGTELNDAEWTWLVDRRFLFEDLPRGFPARVLRSDVRSALVRASHEIGTFQRLYSNLRGYVETRLQDSAIQKSPAEFILRLQLAMLLLVDQNEHNAGLALTDQLLAEAQRRHEPDLANLVWAVTSPLLTRAEQDVLRQRLRQLAGPDPRLVQLGESTVHELASRAPAAVRPTLYFFAGKALATYLEFDKAVAMYDAALRRSQVPEQRGLILKEKALSLIHQGRMEKARATLFERAELLLQRNQRELADLHLDRAIWWMKHGNFELAAGLLKAWESAYGARLEQDVYLKSKFAHLFGQVALYLEGPVQAKPYVEETEYQSERIAGVGDRIIGRDWRRMYARTLKGDVLRLEGSRALDRAMAELRRAIRLAPRFPGFGPTWGTAWLGRAEYAACEARLLLAKCLVAKGSLDEADTELDNLVTQPHIEAYWRCAALLERGRVKKAKGNLAEAIRGFGEALDRSQEFGFRHIQLWSGYAVLELVENDDVSRMLTNLGARYMPGVCRP